MYDESESLQLQAILYIEGELHTALPEIRQAKVLAVEAAGDIEQTMRECGLLPDHCLVLAATDAAIRAAKRLSMAVAGYVNPGLDKQTYYGVEMLIEGFDEVDEAFLQHIFNRHHHIPCRIAETVRCVIREFDLADLDELIELYDQPGITYRLAADGSRLPGYIEPLYPPEEERVYQENYIRHMYRYFGYGMWLVIEKESGRLIGRIGLENRNYPEGMEQELGYLIHPSWQRRGFAAEVCLAVIDYAKKHLECKKLNLLTEADNLASLALAERLGFVYVGDTDISGSRTRRYELFL